MEMKHTLKSLRSIKNLTQKQAASLVGVSVDTWANYEKGKTFPDVPIIVRIEQVFGVSYDDINFLPQDYGLTVKEQVS